MGCVANAIDAVWYFCEGDILSGGSNSAFEEAFNAADNYNLDNDTFVKHILDRHGPNSSFTNKSPFDTGFDIKSGIEGTLRGDIKMNFYIGNSIEDLKKNDRNVELSDDFLEYLNKNKCLFDLEEFVLQEIDPYDDTVIDNSELQRWLSMFDSIVASNILEYYEDSDEVRNIEKLINLINEALDNHQNLIVIGD